MEIVNDKRQIGIRIPHELDERLEQHVKKIGISKPAFILNVIYKELEKVSPEKAQIAQQYKVNADSEAREVRE